MVVHCIDHLPGILLVYKYSRTILLVFQLYTTRRIAGNDFPSDIKDPLFLLVVAQTNYHNADDNDNE